MRFYRLKSIKQELLVVVFLQLFRRQYRYKKLYVRLNHGKRRLDDGVEDKPGCNPAEKLTMDDLPYTTHHFHWREDGALWDLVAHRLHFPLDHSRSHISLSPFWEARPGVMAVAKRLFYFVLPWCFWVCWCCHWCVAERKHQIRCPECGVFSMGVQIVLAMPW